MNKLIETKAISVPNTRDDTVSDDEGTVQKRSLANAATEHERLTLIVQNVFQSVFEHDHIEAQADFFDLGGDSLLGEQVSLEIQKSVGVEFPPSEIFDCPTPFAIAGWLLEHRQVPKKLVQPTRRTTPPQKADVLPTRDNADQEGLIISKLKNVARFFDRLIVRCFGRSLIEYVKEETVGFDAELVRRMNLMHINAWRRNGKPGRLIDSELPIFGLNVDGELPPVFFCFNGQDGPINLAKAIGPDQPIYALRSLANIHLKTNVKRRLELKLGKAYANELEKLFPEEDYILAGNCQGGRVAEIIARELIHRGRRVPLLCVLEYIPDKYYPNRLLLLFGAESRRHNPFLMGLPEEKWKGLHREVIWDIVPGRHTKFFYDPNVVPFAQILKSRLDELRNP